MTHCPAKSQETLAGLIEIQGRSNMQTAGRRVWGHSPQEICLGDRFASSCKKTLCKHIIFIYLLYYRSRSTINEQCTLRYENVHLSYRR